MSEPSPSSKLYRALLISAVASALVFAACGGTTADAGDGSAAAADGADGGGASSDAAATIDDSGASTGGDSGGGGGGGGTSDAGSAARNPSCTPLSKQTGTAVSTSYGRLDGTLVYIVGQGGSAACNGDDSHIHLQVQVGGDVYDVAVDIGKSSDEVGVDQQSLDVPGGVWSEGWHDADSLGYKSVGVHSSSLPLAKPNAVAAQLEGLLASTTHVSIFCTGYDQHNGCHDVHYQNGNSTDGAIVLDPSTANAPVVFLRFSGDSF
ncbi:MAG: hypothetical protein ABI551_05445 [Polyangiaceae bacterium]